MIPLPSLIEFSLAGILICSKGLLPLEDSTIGRLCSRLPFVKSLSAISWVRISTLFNPKGEVRIFDIDEPDRLDRHMWLAGHPRRERIPRR